MARSIKINIFGLLIVFLGLIVGIIYYFGLIKPEPSIAPKMYTDLLEFRTVRFDFSVLENKSFKNLEIFGRIPIDPGVTGRENIFAPF